MKRFFILIAILFITTSAHAQSSGTRSFTSVNSGFVNTTTSSSWLASIPNKASLQSVTVHFSGSTTATVKVVLTSEEGSTYDTVLSSSGGSSVQDFFFQPDIDLVIQRDDDIKVTITTADSVVSFATIVRWDAK